MAQRAKKKKRISQARRKTKGPRSLKSPRDRPQTIDTLHKEHRYMDLLLRELDQRLQAAEPLTTADYYLMQDILSYMHEYPDAVHHPTEDLLFEKLVLRDPSMQQPLTAVRDEHEQLSQSSAELKKLLAAAAELSTPQDEAALTAALRRYSTKLRRHMQREEQELFPHAVACLANQDWRAIDEQLSRAQDPLFGPEVAGGYRVLYEYFAAPASAASQRWTSMDMKQFDNLIQSAEAFDSGARQLLLLLREQWSAVRHEGGAAARETFRSRHPGAALARQLSFATFLGKTAVHVGTSTTRIYVNTARQMLRPYFGTEQQE